MKLKFYTADAFTDKVFHGAQIAVFPQASELDGARMQLLARELNLPGAVFVLPPTDTTHSYRLRLFLPAAEIDFGGHAIVATAHVLAATGAITLSRKHTPIVLRLNIGLIQVYITGEQGQPNFVQFSQRTRAQVDRFVPSYQELADILGLAETELEKIKYTPLLVSCGYPYLIVPLRTYAAVRKARFDFNTWSQTSAPEILAREILLFSTQTLQPSSDFHARLVGPQMGIHDDPPIGSSLPAFAHYLCTQPHIKKGTYTFTIDRGQAETRQSVLNMEMVNQQTGELDIRVGGQAVMISEGEITLPD